MHSIDLGKEINDIKKDGYEGWICSDKKEFWMVRFCQKVKVSCRESARMKSMKGNLYVVKLSSLYFQKKKKKRSTNNKARKLLAMVSDQPLKQCPQSSDWEKRVLDSRVLRFLQGVSTHCFLFFLVLIQKNFNYGLIYFTAKQNFGITMNYIDQFGKNWFLKKNNTEAWAWWCVPVILALKGWGWRIPNSIPAWVIFSNLMNSILKEKSNKKAVAVAQYKHPEFNC